MQEAELRKVVLEPGFEIHADSDSQWFILYNGNRRNLIENEDFFSVWLLLERPFEEVRAELDEVRVASGAHKPFPMWKVIAAALDSRSGNWTERAMVWAPNLPSEDKAKLRDSLVATKDSKWASQKSRQAAHRLLKEIERN